MPFSWRRLSGKGTNVNQRGSLLSDCQLDPRSENEFSAARLILFDGNTNTFADVGGLFAICECEQEEQCDNGRVGRAGFPCNCQVVHFQDPSEMNTAQSVR